MTIRIYLTGLLLTMAALSCKKDNYDEPTVNLKGKITYQGEAINVSSKDVYFELWQPGWGKSGAITMNVLEDGSYSNLLFSGDYKLVIPKSQGPWMSIPNNETNSDTILLHLTGSREMDIEVMPYYMVREPNFTKNGTSVDATCKLEKIITDANAKEIEKVYLYLNQTQIVDGTNYIARTTLSGSAITDLNNVALSVTIPASTSVNGGTGQATYVFARIGVKISGVEDLLFSPVQQINL